jgi:hypothetical protein
MNAISPFKILDDVFRLFVAETPATVNNKFYVSHKRSLQDIRYVTAAKFNVI